MALGPKMAVSQGLLILDRLLKLKIFLYETRRPRLWIFGILESSGLVSRLLNL